MTARDMLEWNGVLPNVSVVDVTPDDHATSVYAVIADYGWAERILCTGCYRNDAHAIAASLEEVTGRVHA